MPPVHPLERGRSRVGGPNGAHRALERRHLRPRGRRDREPRRDVPVDVHGHRRGAQARRRRRDRVRGRAPGARRPSATPSSRPAGRLAAKVVIHAVSLERDRRTSGPAIDRAARSAMARVRELGLASVAFPALGTGIGGFPLDEAARIAVTAVRDELEHSPSGRARHLRAPRRGGLRGVRARPVRWTSRPRPPAARVRPVAVGWRRHPGWPRSPCGPRSPGRRAGPRGAGHRF